MKKNHNPFKTFIAWIVFAIICLLTNQAYCQGVELSAEIQMNLMPEQQYDFKDRNVLNEWLDRLDDDLNTNVIRDENTVKGVITPSIAVRAELVGPHLGHFGMTAALGGRHKFLKTAILPTFKAQIHAGVHPLGIALKNNRFFDPGNKLDITRVLELGFVFDRDTSIPKNIVEPINTFYYIGSRININDGHKRRIAYFRAQYNKTAFIGESLIKSDHFTVAAGMELSRIIDLIKN